MSAAVKLAKRERMDLLPVAPNARPPVFRLGDANEAAKQARLRERDMRRREMENRRKTLMKEVRRLFWLMKLLPWMFVMDVLQHFAVLLCLGRIWIGTAGRP